MPNDKNEEAKQTILIVDDHPLLRRGLAAIIEGETDISVYGEAFSTQGALDAIEQGGDKKPDLAIIDLGLEESDGLELIKEIKVRYPEISMLVISMHDESLYAERALRAGALGYLTKQHLDDTVLTAIRHVLDGKRYLSAAMLEQFTDKFFTGGRNLKSDSPLAVLTDRELEVFRLIGQGNSTRKIAERLGRSVKTIESHRENLKQKLSLESGAALVQRAIHWVDTGEAS